MAKRTLDTIENRVYLFESLARALLESQADGLVARDGGRRARVLRALGDLARVSCAVADGQALSPDEVQRAVAGSPGPRARRRQ